MPVLMMIDNNLNIYLAMKREERMSVAYEAPQVEVIEVEVEKGFAGSLESPGQDPEEGM